MKNKFNNVYRLLLLLRPMYCIRTLIYFICEHDDNIGNGLNNYKCLTEFTSIGTANIKCVIYKIFPSWCKFEQCNELTGIGVCNFAVEPKQTIHYTKTVAD